MKPVLLELGGAEQIALLTEGLRKGQTTELLVNGPCMWPWVRNSNRIRVAPLPDRVCRGAIVLATDGEHLYAHRVLRVGDDGAVQTRGDLSQTDDLWRSAEQVLGHVIGVRRRGVWWPLGWRLVELFGLGLAPLLRRCRGCIPSG